MKSCFQICQACGERIEWQEKAIEIRYGKLEGYVRVPKNRVSTREKDFFHQKCMANVAIRTK